MQVAFNSIDQTTVRASTHKTGMPHIGFWRGAKCLCLAGTSYLAVLSFRVAACFVSIFSNRGKNLAERIRSKADRVYIIYVAHPLRSYSFAPLPLLVPARNLARRDVVGKGEDIAAANALRQRFLSPGFLKKQDPTMEAHLKRVQFKGANKDGICFGGSFCFIKSVLNARCSSEEELIRVAQVYVNGFPKEAAGLQMMHAKLAHWPSNSSRSANQGVLDFVDQENAEIMRDIQGKRNQLLNEARQGNAQRVIEQLDKVVQEEEKKFQARLDTLQKHIPFLKNAALIATQFGKLAKLIGIKVQKRPMRDFLQFDRDAAACRRFNVLPNGNYLMSFNVKNSRHVMTYHKFDFGSYLFDPNRGLMKCQTSDPAKDLAKLLKIYPGNPRFAQEGPHQLQVISCELAKVK
ncbi:MAG: hypothetical protein LLG04_05670 [Parachlamydia sp.]|nr:hypothetical protein [Parachlamydia sp.]